MSVMKMSKVLSIVLVDNNDIDGFKLKKQDETDYLFVSSSNMMYETDFLEKFLDSYLLEKQYSRVEIINKSIINFDVDLIINVLAKYENIKNNLTELYVQNDGEKQLSKSILNFIKKLLYLETFECSAISIEQYLNLSKDIKYIFSNSSSDEIRSLYKNIRVLNQYDYSPTKNEFSISDCKYSTKLRINNAFENVQNNNEMQKLLVLASNLEDVEFEFESIRDKEKDFILDFVHLTTQKDRNINPVIFSNFDNQVYCSDEIDKLKYADILLNKLDKKLTFSSKLSYIKKNLDEIVSASNKFNENIEFINKQNLSLYEQYLLAYFFAKNYRYHEDEQNIMKSRNIIDLINNKQGVCIAFSSLLQAYLERLSIPSIQEDVVISKSWGSDKENHSRLIVYLKDEKYNLNGLFIADPTSDSFDNKFDNTKFCFANMPLNYKMKDTNEFSKSTIVQLARLKNLNGRLGKVLFGKQVFVNKFYNDLIELNYINEKDRKFDGVKLDFNNLNHFMVSNYFMMNDKDVVSQEYFDKALKLCEKIKLNSVIDENTFYKALEKVLSILQKNELINNSEISDIIFQNKTDISKFFKSEEFGLS